MRVIVIRQDEYQVLVVARIPEETDGETTFMRWAADSDVKKCLRKSGLQEAYWEELKVVDV